MACPRDVLAVVPGRFVSGAEMLLVRDLVAARDAGWGVRVACSNGPLVERLRDAGIDRVPIPDLRLGNGNRLIAGARLALATATAARVLRRQRRDSELLLVNGINALPAAALAGRTILHPRSPAARAPRGVVLFAHDVLVRRDRLELVRRVRRWLRGAIAVSDAAAGPLRALGIRTVVARQGTEWPVAPAPGRPDGPPRIGIAAAITEWKGHAVLLEAMTRLSHPGAMLEVMGAAPPKDGGYELELRRRARELGLADRVQFVGHVAEPLERMRTWTVAVVASIEPEAGPLTALEAMSVGVPVVATDHGGVREVLGDAGLLVPPGNAPALAAAIERVIRDRAFDARCRDAGPLQIVAAHLTQAEHEARFVNALDRLWAAP